MAMPKPGQPRNWELVVDLVGMNRRCEFRELKSVGGPVDVLVGAACFATLDLFKEF
jgi:hypothetical protein